MRIAPAGLMAVAICYATLASARLRHPGITVTAPQPKAWPTLPTQPAVDFVDHARAESHRGCLGAGSFSAPNGSADLRSGDLALRWYAA